MWYIHILLWIVLLFSLSMFTLYKVSQIKMISMFMILFLLQSMAHVPLPHFMRILSIGSTCYSFSNVYIRCAVFTQFCDKINSCHDLWINPCMRGIQKEMSRKPRNRNQYLYVRSIGPGCWGICPTAIHGGEWLSRKIPGAVLWTSSACTAWRCHSRWIVCPSEPFFRGSKMM